PFGWGVDAEGKSVDDPEKVVSLTPLGGAKGYGLSMIVDIFSGLLSGETFGPHISKMYENLNEKRKLGHYFCVINPEMFTSKVEFLSEVDQMIDELHQVSPTSGFEKVYVPGEIEKEKEINNYNNGIDIAKSVYDFLKK